MSVRYRPASDAADHRQRQGEGEGVETGRAGEMQGRTIGEVGRVCTMGLKQLDLVLDNARSRASPVVELS